MQCDQTGLFLFEPKVPKTFKHKTVSTKLSEFPKILHTRHHIQMCECCGPSTVLQSPTIVVFVAMVLP